MVQTDNNNIPWEVRSVLPFAAWIDRHPRISNIVLWLMGLAFLWEVLNYNFTTHI